MTKHAPFPHPNDYWIVASYHYKPWPTPEAAEEARVALAAQFPKQQFRVLHCKRHMGPSDSGAKIDRLRLVLDEARSFINGFEGDEMLEGVDRLLGRIDAALLLTKPARKDAEATSLPSQAQGEAA